MFAMFIISMTMANLFTFGLAFLFVLPIDFGDIDLETLFAEDRPALGLRLRVVLRAAAGDREFRTLLLESNSLAMLVFLPTLGAKDCKTLFVKRPIGFGHIQGLLGVFALEVWRRVAIRAWFALR